MQVPICRHIRPNGLQCQAVALKTSVFCYFHHRLNRSHRIYRNTISGRPGLERKGVIFDLGTLEDSVSIQIAISKVVNAIATNMIDLKHGRTILYGLHLAATNARKLNPIPEPQAVVRDLTTTRDDYDTPTDIAPEGATTDLDVQEPTTPPTELVPKPTMLERILEQERTKSDPQPAPAAEPGPPTVTLCAATEPSQSVGRHRRTHRNRTPSRKRPTVQFGSMDESKKEGGSDSNVRHTGKERGTVAANAAGDCVGLCAAGAGGHRVGAI